MQKPSFKMVDAFMDKIFAVRVVPHPEQSLDH
jgi:hypothetical protein